MASTAPTAKFGATRMPRSGRSALHCRTVSSRSGVNPEVPTTQWIPLSSAHRMLSSTTSGWVKSTTTWAPASETENSQSPASTMATTSRSSTASTARTTSAPIRPRAPTTPTRIGSALIPFSSPVRLAARSGAVPLTACRPPSESVGKPCWRRRGTANRLSRQHPVEVLLLERADHRQAPRAAEQVGGNLPDIVRGDGIDPGEQLVHAEHLAVYQLRLADPAHPAAGVLQPEHQAALDLALPPGH